ncbi:immunoglobulin-like domain-containing protein [Microbacterium sp. AZCO]|uniref:immunoglobulin-like domain-containing protein n=1 Tax=Microbacterium sp. AZCO TaxID=3142976 RepID=UPI0031F3C629
MTDATATSMLGGRRVAAAARARHERMRARTRSRFLSRGTAVATATALALAGAVAPATMASAAIDVAPLIHYTFDSTSGTSIPDVSGNGYNATLQQSGATFQNGVLTLPGGARGTGAYVDIPTAGLVGKKDLTISTWMSNKSGPANLAAAFIGAPVASGASYSSAYWLLNLTNPSGYVKSVVTNTASATAPWSTEVGAGSSNAPTTGIKTPAGMSLYTTVIDGTNGQLRTYVNGTIVTTTTIARNVSSFGSSLVSYLGRSTYNDPAWNGDVDDYAVYGQALDATKVQQLFSDEALDRAVGSVTVPATATASFTLPTSTYGTTVSWASNNAAIAVSGGAASVTRPAAGQPDASVTLTATFTAGGQTRTKTYVVTVPADVSDATKAQQDIDAIAIANIDDVRTNFSVPTTGAAGSTISWAVTSGGDFASLRAGVTAGSTTVDVSRPTGSTAADVVLTATATNGTATRTREFRVTVQPLPGATDATEAYVWAFFTGEGAGAERVSLAASKGNDALAWNTLNGGQPLFTSTQGTTGLRDPFIIRSHEGDRFYMLATDLKVAGLAGGFTTAQISGSRYIEVWESDDLVHWSNQRHVKVSSDFAGNTWAPEAYWDAELDTYVVFWASNLYPTANTADRTAVTYNRMMYATTDDFVTFSEPKIWSDVKRGNGLGLIDSTVAKVNDVYYRFTKDEASMTIRQEKSTNLLATESGTLPGTTGPADQWTLIKEKVATGLPNGEPGGVYSSGEGPSIFPANPGDVNNMSWYLFIDQPDYHGGPNHYIPFGTTDITNGDSWLPFGAKLRANLPQNSDGGKPRHGTVIPVTRAEYQKVLEAYAPAIAVTSVGALAATTKEGVAPTLPATALLTKKDGSQETAAVTWETVAPSKYATAGTFTVKGVAQDASRQPVEATVTVETAITVSVTAETRCVAGKVVLSTGLANGSATPVDIAVTTAYGTKSATLAAGASTSYAFTTRLASTQPGQISVTATANGATKTVTASYAAKACS